jgi:tetratricopeptide (TPR) repeat protein
MRIRYAALAFFIVIAAGACTPPGTVTTKDYNRFAIRAQEVGLWREAEYRLRQALAESPDDARLHNNLAVALEAQGKLEEAYAEYNKAVKSDPENEMYSKNLRDFTAAHRWEYDPGEEDEEDAPAEEGS